MMGFSFNIDTTTGTILLLAIAAIGNIIMQVVREFRSISHRTEVKAAVVATAEKVDTVQALVNGRHGEVLAQVTALQAQLKELYEQMAIAKDKHISDIKEATTSKS